MAMGYECVVQVTGTETCLGERLFQAQAECESAIESEDRAAARQKVDTGQEAPGFVAQSASPWA